MCADSSDLQLLNSLKADDIAAFNKIYDLYSKALYRYLFQKLKDHDVCSDLLQDIFINIWEKRAALSISLSIRAYLYQTARYKIIDVYRSNMRYEHYLEQLAVYINSEHSVTDRLDQQQKLRDIEIAINKLPTRMREIFVLSRFKHKTYNDIALQTNLSVQTVKNQISKALRLLRLSYIRLDIILLLTALFLKK